jgi:CTD small phosphatase-like protein 2
MDPNRKYIKYRLYRHHTSIYGISFVKDLNKLGRDIERIIIVDNLQDNFKLQPYNGIPIKTWNDDMNDNELYYLCSFLKKLYTFNIKDVRCVIKNLSEDINMKMKSNVVYPYMNIDFNKYFK